MQLVTANSRPLFCPAIGAHADILQFTLQIVE
ncbi:Uncharacterised protein [Shigella sonnei]|nr:Uncharacterised protein [Shigella sonnei]